MRYFLSVALLLASAFTVQADIIVQQGGGNFDDENVLFQADEDVSGNPIPGITNQTGTLVTFTTTDLLGLFAPSQGQARIEGGLDANEDPTLYSNLGIDLANGSLFFRTLSFNVNASEDATLALTVNWVCQTGADCGPGTSPFMDTFEIDGGGENRFLIEAINGQLIDSVSFTTSALVVQDTRQIRIGGVGENVPQGGGEIPEPMSMSLLGAGLGAIGLLKRKARKA